MGQTGSVFSGKTLDEAVRKGLDALGLSRAQVMIKTIEEGSGGFLGLGARPYKVQVTPRPGGAPHEPEARGRRGRSDRGRGGRSGGRSERGGRGGRERRGRGDRPERPERGRRGERQATAARNGRAEEEKKEPKREPKRESVEASSDADTRKPRRRGRRGGRGRRGERRGSAAEAMPVEAQDQEQVDVVAEAPVEEGIAERSVAETPAETPLAAEAPAAAEKPAVAEQTEASVEEPFDEDRRARRSGRSRRRRGSHGGTAVADDADAPPAGTIDADELSTRAREATEALLGAMGFEAEVSAKAEGDRVDVTAEVPSDDDLLTGRKGEVRQALQHLLNRVINRGDASRFHLQLEINDFWQQREDELREIAQGLAKGAIDKDDEVVTEYLNSQERRIIHVTLRDDERVKTYALGTGLIKRVAIAPADFPGGEDA